MPGFVRPQQESGSSSHSSHPHEVIEDEDYPSYSAMYPEYASNSSHPHEVIEDEDEGDHYPSYSATTPEYSPTSLSNSSDSSSYSPTSSSYSPTTSPQHSPMYPTYSPAYPFQYSTWQDGTWCTYSISSDNPYFEETIKEMQNQMRRTECELDVLKNENESLKKRNKMVLELQDKLCNQRRSLEDENKSLKKRIQDLHNKSENERHDLQVKNENLTEKLHKVKTLIENM